MNAIEVKNLKKSFGSTQAVRGVDFHAVQGEILSLLGPNGAGKSTTISMLSGLLSPSDGDAFHYGKFGHPVNEILPKQIWVLFRKKLHFTLIYPP